MVTLTCTATGGYPAPNVFIYRGEKVVASGSKTTSLQRKLQKADNNAMYKCESATGGMSGVVLSNNIVYNVKCKSLNLVSLIHVKYCMAVGTGGVQLPAPSIFCQTKES